MDNSENKKAPEEPAEEELTDEELEDVAGGKSVIIQNRSSTGPNIGGIV